MFGLSAAFTGTLMLAAQGGTGRYMMKNTAEEQLHKEHIKLSSRLWLGGADCMITTLCNIITGGGLTFYFVNYYGMDPG